MLGFSRDATELGTLEVSYGDKYYDIYTRFRIGPETVLLFITV